LVRRRFFEWHETDGLLVVVMRAGVECARFDGGLLDQKLDEDRTLVIDEATCPAP